MVYALYIGKFGKSKGCCSFILQFVVLAQFSNDNLPFSSGHRWLQSLFLWHIGGLMIPIRALLHGGSSIVEKDPVMTMGDQVDRDRITHLSVVATQLYDLLQGDHTLDSLKGVLVGGGTFL